MVKRSLIFVHRWLGVALCVLFLLWFPSGIGMMYWTYPDVTPADRLERAPAIDASRVKISPAEAAARIYSDEPPSALATFDGRPAYRFGRGGPVVYADTGEEQIDVPQAMVDRAAAAWTGQPLSAARVEEAVEVDQWTLQLRVQELSPLWKYSWPNGEHVYVSGLTGEVAQYTTTASRIGAWLGPIPHWFYFTPLRKHGPEWSRVVIWSSGIGTIVAIIGLVVGVWMYSPRKPYRRDGAPTSIPYRGQKRWHTVLGLVFGVATVTWAFSGMLSMDPFPELYGAAPRSSGPDLRRTLRGDVALDTYTRSPQDALAQLSVLQVKQLEFSSFAGEAVYIATLADGTTRIVPMQGPPMPSFGTERIVEVVTRAAPRAETRVLDQYDRYYLDRQRRRPLPVVLALMQDEADTRYYIDPGTGRVVATYDAGDWVNRWLYNGLHSLNFPWLYNYRPLWDVVVIGFMLGGTALCVTSLVLAWRVLGRSLRSLTA